MKNQIIKRKEMIFLPSFGEIFRGNLVMDYHKDLCRPQQSIQLCSFYLHSLLHDGETMSYVRCYKKDGELVFTMRESSSNETQRRHVLLLLLDMSFSSFDNKNISPQFLLKHIRTMLLDKNVLNHFCKKVFGDGSSKKGHF